MTLRMIFALPAALFCWSLLATAAAESAAAQPPAETAAAAADTQPLIGRAVSRLIELQEEDGAWPYEGVYRVGGRIPVGYRVGGTAIACQALLYARQQDEDDPSAGDAALRRGVQVMLEDLQDSRMQASTADRYDVRVWGHIFALDLFCRLELSEQFADIRKSTQPWISKLTRILMEEEIPGGGWNYANQRSHAAFVTAPAVQALLLARQTGQDVPEAVLERAAGILVQSRTDSGAFQYSGTAGGRRVAKLPGSIARSAIAEATLVLLDQGNAEHLQNAIDAFYEHWDELEKRRQKTGTHQPPYGVAPYYFYYGHRYLAQAIELLPAARQAREYERFRDILLKTREADDTWNDRVFERSKAYGTAMSILALQGPAVPLPAGVDSGGK